MKLQEPRKPWSLACAMSLPILEACKKRKRRPKLFRFHSFADPGCPIDPVGPFRENIRLVLRECAEPEDYCSDGMSIWCTLLLHENNSFVVLLYTIEENLHSSPDPYCDHCRTAGWSNHFVSKSKYRILVPHDRQWNKPQDDGEAHRIKMVATHLEGVALQWHQSFIRDAEPRGVTWQQYLEALEARFSREPRANPLPELINLKQWGSVTDYQSSFHALCSRVQLSAEQGIVLCLSGLKEEIRTPVKMFNPQTRKVKANSSACTSKLPSILGPPPKPCSSYHPGYRIDTVGPFRENIRLSLRECAEPEDGMSIWCTLLLHENKSFVVPLYTIEENLHRSTDPYCDHCRTAGWSNHFVSKSKYHILVPNDRQWNKSLDDGVIDLQTHLLHGLIHSNGAGHLLCINGIEGGSKFLCGREIMDLWDRICQNLRVRLITVADPSRKRSIDLRLLYGVAYCHHWFGRWGYKFFRGSFGVTEANCRKAIMMKVEFGVFDEEGRPAYDPQEEVAENINIIVGGENVALLGGVPPVLGIGDSILVRRKLPDEAGIDPVVQDNMVELLVGYIPRLPGANTPEALMLRLGTFLHESDQWGLDIGDTDLEFFGYTFFDQRIVFPHFPDIPEAFDRPWITPVDALFGIVVFPLE